MYKHTQTGWVMIVCLVAALLFILPGSLNADSVVGIFLASAILMSLFIFVSLTVSVTAGHINVVFGIGLIQMRIKISEVVSLGIVKNKWWYGFGIHGWWGKGWLLNVSGLSAVELKIKNGMVYRIGTDEPQKLNDAIQEKINKA
ncbi:MAG: hypothetical protein WCI77_07075 [Candidatus Omnitrophota bacterium]